MKIRRYRPDDAEALAHLYRDAVQHRGPSAYTPEQVRAWARYPEDLGAFRAALAQGLTLCAMQDDAPVTFGQLYPVNHIAYLYCVSAHARRGYASAILSRLEDQARLSGVSTLHVEASAVARPFFARFGYRVIEEERPWRHGVEILRFKMKKELTQPVR